MNRYLVALCAACAAFVAAAEVMAEAPVPPGADASASQASKKLSKRKKVARKKGGSRSPREARREPAAELELKSAWRLGYAHGLGKRRFDAVVSETRLELEPQLRVGVLRARAPLGLRHTYFAGQPLSQTRASGELDLEFKATRWLRPFAELGVDGVWRPRWPDLYQPLGDDEYVRSSRYSYWDRRVAGGTELKLARGSELELAYRYELRVYERDSAFDPVQRPNHLTPGDREEQRLGLGVRHRVAGVRLRAEVEAFTRRYFFVFARDEGTGRTHAGPGGAPPNPLQELRGIEPRFRIQVNLGELTLKPEYGLSIVEDAFQGYYSHVEHWPGLEAEVELGKRWQLATGAKLGLRGYGAGSYAAGGSHPALEYGDRLNEQRFAAHCEANYALTRELQIGGRFELASRRTNFPDYRPDVFPEGASYDIRWDYDNYRVLFGVSYND